MLPLYDGRAHDLIEWHEQRIADSAERAIRLISNKPPLKISEVLWSPNWQVTLALYAPRWQGRTAGCGTGSRSTGCS